MKNKTEISYWLDADGEQTLIMNVEVSKVPEKGEKISFDNNWDNDRAERIYSHLSEKQKKTFFPKPEVLLSDYYMVTSVNRYIKIDYIKTKLSSVFPGYSLASESPSMQEPEIPIQMVRETFEVMLKPYQECELNATPISKVRNLLGSILGSFEILKLVKEHPEKEAELMEMFKSSSETAIESIPELRDILSNENNWK